MTDISTEKFVEAHTHSARRAWAAVALLALVGTLNYADRFLPAVLAEPIKNDLALSDTAIGVINGFWFLLVYAVLGLVIARIADRGAFGAVIAACLTLWGAMTMLGGAVQSGFQLALTRVGVAVGEAGSTPAAHAYVARNFPPEKRAGAVGGHHHVDPVGQRRQPARRRPARAELGWRTAFVVMGAISVLFAPLVLLVLGRRQSMPVAAAAAGDKVQAAKWWICSRNRASLPSSLGAAFISFAGYSLTTFAPAFLIRTREMSLGEVGVAIRPRQWSDRNPEPADRRSGRRSPVRQGPSLVAVDGGRDDRCHAPVLGPGVPGGEPDVVHLVHRAELRRRHGVHGAVDRGDPATGAASNSARRRRRSSCSSAPWSDRQGRS